MHDMGCVIDHYMVACVGGMAVDVGYSAIELSMNVFSFNSEWKLLFSTVDTIDGTHVLVNMWIHPPIRLLKCTNNPNNLGMTTMTFHCVSASRGNKGFA